MLDVIHVLFERDTLPTWEQDIDIKNQVRQSIYQQMYGENYKYGHSSSQGRSSEWDTADGSPDMYGAPAEGVIKPYIPPTDPDELFDILGTPMGE